MVCDQISIKRVEFKDGMYVVRVSWALGDGYEATLTVPGARGKLKTLLEEAARVHRDLTSIDQVSIMNEEELPPVTPPRKKRRMI